MNDKTETLHKLCDALMEELEDYSKKIEKEDGMSAGDLDAVDKLSHALKSVKTTIAMMEASDSGNGYSGRNMTAWRYPAGTSYADGTRNGTGNSFARGRMNSRRDSMGRYSGTGYSYADGMEDLLEEMRGMLPGLSDEKRRMAEQLIDELGR